MRYAAEVGRYGGEGILVVIALLCDSKLPYYFSGCLVLFVRLQLMRVWMGDNSVDNVSLRWLNSASEFDVVW